MPTRFATTCTEEDLMRVELPAKTRTYTPVPNEMIFNVLHDQLDKHNLKVVSTDLTMSAGGRRFIGLYDIESDDEELGYRIGFKNSYDGTMAFGMGVGSVVWLCSNGMVHGEISEKRIHTGNAEEDVEEIICTSLQEYQKRHSENIKTREHLKTIYCSTDEIATLMGKLCLKGAMNGNELQRMKKEIMGSTLFRNLTDNPDGIGAWDLYNHGTEALKAASFNTYFEKHNNLHKVFKERYGIA